MQLGLFVCPGPVLAPCLFVWIRCQFSPTNINNQKEIRNRKGISPCYERKGTPGGAYNAEMSRQTSTTAPDRGKTKQIRSRGRRRGTRNSGHHQHPVKETKRSARWRCTNHTTNAASSTTTAAGELPNHMGRERLLPRRQHRAKQEWEESEKQRRR